MGHFGDEITWDLKDRLKDNKNLHCHLSPPFPPLVSRAELRQIWEDIGLGQFIYRCLTSFRFQIYCFILKRGQYKYESKIIESIYFLIRTII